jgi:hypothetical protein
MTLADITFPVTYEWGVAHALVFDAQLAARLAELQAQHGRPDYRTHPRELIDGRYMFTADILTSVEPGGPLHAMWEAADHSILFPAVEVMPLADAVALLPPDPPIE